MKQSTIATSLFSLVWLVAIWGCNSSQETGAEDQEAGASEDFVEIDEDTLDEEKLILKVARPIMIALADGKFDEFYECLSSHARKRMSVNQFVAPDNDAEFRENEQQPLEDVSREQFIDQMKKITEMFGAPLAPESLSVASTDSEVLAGRGDRFDVMISIGAIPDSVPIEIRRAALRGQVRTHFKPEELKRISQEYGMTAEEIQQDDEMYPYYNIKLVLVEESGELKVGYFEFLPPSILD